MKAKLFALVLFTFVSVGAMATETTNVENAQARANQLIERVQEIRTLDRSEMSSEEKSEIKAELRLIKQELKEIKSTKGLDDKVSISIGAIIIIILLLIIL